MRHLQKQLKGNGYLGADDGVNTAESANIHQLYRHKKNRCLDPEDMTKAEIFLRRQIAAVVRFLQKNIRGSRPRISTGLLPGICVRRTRTVICEYDITNRTHYREEQRLFLTKRSSLRIPRPGAYLCGQERRIIWDPYRFAPVRIDSLLVAGRMITTEYKAHMSTRNTVCCMAQGHAASTAAAIAALRVRLREPCMTCRIHCKPKECIWKEMN